MIAVSVKPCIVNVLHIPFQNTPLPGAFDLYFTFLVILPDAGAISTSAEFLFYIVLEQTRTDKLKSVIAALSGSYQCSFHMKLTNNHMTFEIRKLLPSKLTNFQ